MPQNRRVPHLYTSRRNDAFVEREKERELRIAREAQLAETLGPGEGVPYDMVRTMFKQRMQALLMQDRKQLRRVFEQFDTQKRGQLTLDQFHTALNKLAPGMGIDKKMATELLKRFSGQPGYILFQDFVVNFLGLPPDFFSMKLSNDNPNAAPEKEVVTSVKEFKHGTPIEKVEKTFVRRMRKRLLNVKAAMNVALKRPGDTATYMNENDLWYLMRDQGMMCTQKEINEIMEHFDQNRDGKIHYEEFAHELLGLPRPAAVRHIQPFHAKRPALTEQSQQLVHRLATKCERAAAAPTRLHSMFKAFDKDGSGSIAYDEFLSMIQEFGCEMEGNDAAAALLNKFDRDGQGELSYGEFVTDVLGLQASALNKSEDPNNKRCSTPEMMQSVGNNLKKRVFSDRDAIMKGFQAFDKDGGGSLSFPEFRDGLKTLGLPITGAQAKKLFTEFDKGGQGEISTEGFASDVLGVRLGQSFSPCVSSHKSSKRTPLPQLPQFTVPAAQNQSRKGKHKSQGGAPRMPTEFMPGRSKTSLDGRISRREDLLLGASRRSLSRTH